MGSYNFDQLLFYALLAFCAVVGFACVLNVIAMRKGNAALVLHPTFTPPPQTALQAEESAKTEEHKILTLLDVIPECVGAEVKSVFYKSKIRAILRNDTEKTIEVASLHWAFGANELACQEQIEATLQVEGARGWRQNHWQKEDHRIHVRPGHAFRLWVGLLLDVSRTPDDRCNELRQRAVIKQLGTLELIIDNREWRLHL